MSSSKQKELKCILVGESGTGKTCLINALIQWRSLVWMGLLLPKE